LGKRSGRSDHYSSIVDASYDIVSASQFLATKTTADYDLTKRTSREKHNKCNDRTSIKEVFDPEVTFTPSLSNLQLCYVHSCFFFFFFFFFFAIVQTLKSQELQVPIFKNKLDENRSLSLSLTLIINPIMKFVGKKLLCWQTLKKLLEEKNKGIFLFSKRESFTVIRQSWRCSSSWNIQSQL